MENWDEESLLGRGLLEELDDIPRDTRSVISKQGSLDSTGSSSSQYSIECSDVDFECHNLMLNSCLNKIQNYSLSGRSRMGTPPLEKEAQIQCTFRSLGLPDDGMPGPRLMERYISRCKQSKEVMSAIQSTIGTCFNSKMAPF